MDPDLPTKMDTDPDAQPCQEKNPAETGSDSNSDSETVLDIKKTKRNKMLHILGECLTAPIWETTESKTNNKLIQVECLHSKTSTYIHI